MKYLVVFVLVLLVCVTIGKRQTGSKKGCRAERRRRAKAQCVGGIDEEPCRNPCLNRMISSKSKCFRTKYCCWKGGSCIMKPDIEKHVALLSSITSAPTNVTSASLNVTSAPLNVTSAPTNVTSEMPGNFTLKPIMGRIFLRLRYPG
ncbi:uncharacterized protein LOC143447480 [Clavelina lepadiformis]|uniref:uncharacterized protein LOC143447480 n=1 Tax=Clavelina lepadiformis TaxID=159417 RepID=UPI004042EDC7